MPLTQVLIAKQSANVAMEQSRNSTAVAVSTNNTFGNIAGLIQAAPTSTTLSGTGTLGSGTYTPPSVVAPVTVVEPITIVPPLTVIAPPGSTSTTTTSTGP